MKKILPLMIFVLLLAACATAGSPSVKDQSRISQIKKNETTQDQIVELFGQPQVKKTKEDGTEVWEYAYVETAVTGATFIPIVGLFAGGANSKVDGIEIEFNRNNLVSKYATSTGEVQSQNFGQTQTNIEKKEH